MSGQTLADILGKIKDPEVLTKVVGVMGFLANPKTKEAFISALEAIKSIDIKGFTFGLTDQYSLVFSKARDAVSGKTELSITIKEN